MIFLVVDGQHSTRFNPLLLFVSKGHGLKEHGISYKLIQSWSHVFKAAIEEKRENNFCQSVQKMRREEN